MIEGLEALYREEDLDCPETNIIYSLKYSETMGKRNYFKIHNLFLR